MMRQTEAEGVRQDIDGEPKYAEFRETIRRRRAEVIKN